MATKTQGFALSSMPRSPAIPANVGAVDVKEIYDGVRQGLAAFETARRAPASMLLADAEMKAKTAEAPLGTALMEEQVTQAPINTRRILAQTEGAEFAVSPEMKAAELAAKTARASAKPLTGVPYLLNRMDELRRGDQTDPAILSAIADTQFALNKLQTETRPNPTAERDAKTDMAADANATKVATTDAAIASREREGERERATRQAIADADRKARTATAQSQLAHKTMRDSAKTDQQRAAAGAKARGALSVGTKRNEFFNETVEKAVENLTGTRGGVAMDSSIPGGNILAAISRVIGTFIPGSEDTDLEALIATLKSEAGFTELANMRDAAPGNTGASGLGNVTEKELAFLQNRIANIRLSQSDKQLYENIKRFQEAVNTAWKNAAAAYEFDYGSRGQSGVMGAPAAPIWDEAKEKELRALEAKLAAPAQP